MINGGVQTNGHQTFGISVHKYPQIVSPSTTLQLQDALAMFVASKMKDRYSKILQQSGGRMCRTSLLPDQALQSLQTFEPLEGRIQGGWEHIGQDSQTGGSQSGLIGIQATRHEAGHLQQDATHGWGGKMMARVAQEWFRQYRHFLVGNGGVLAGYGRPCILHHKRHVFHFVSSRKD